MLWVRMSIQFESDEPTRIDQEENGHEENIISNSRSSENI